MMILTRYIFRAMSFGLVMAVSLLLAIDVLFGLIKELNDISPYYTLGDVFFFVILTIPSKIYELFPVSAVIAVAVSLGALAAGSELVVMRSVGISQLRIAGMMLLALLVWLVPVTLMGEYVSPKAEQMAQQFRNEKISAGQATSVTHAVWIKDGDVVFRSNKMTKQPQSGQYLLTGVTVFELENQQLVQVSEAEKALYANQQWTLENLKVSVFNDHGVQVKQIASQQWQSRIKPRILNLSTTRAKYLSLRDLKQIQQFNTQSGSLQSAYQMAWWSKLAFPLLVITTALCGMLVLFGHVRNAGFSQRLVMGMVIGIVIYLMNKTLLNVGEVYHLSPPLMVVVPPALICMVVLFYLSGGIKRTGRKLSPL
ncbi:MAG: LPS export ABC transporter permease LptG [Proteobacteria bacterium]|nr:MAG: LPS export ABC transporter permease LptG [Pseudomonadota bacterium]